ncbi:MAG: O-methyltransferase [Bacteroidota bacterium]
MIDLPYATLQAHAEQYTTAGPPLLATIYQETHANVPMPRMLSGHLQGRVLAMLSRMLQPRNILELGTYTGYSALCLAEGLQQDGILHTIDNNAALERRVKGYFSQAGIQHQVKYHIGEALDIIPQLSETFDLVFIDADKKNYLRYYRLVLDRVRPGGFILVDNVLLRGSVLSQADQPPGRQTQAMIDFNTQVHQDPRVENLLLPIRDGLMVLRKSGALPKLGL